LTLRRHIRAAARVCIVTAASSSVALAAIQIANRLGATTVAITRTSRKSQALREAGAAHVIASAEDDLEARLTSIAGPQNIRVVLDPIGGPIFVPLTAAMARGGILIEYGGLSLEPTPFPLFNVLRKSLTLRGYLVHEIVGDPARLKDFCIRGDRRGASLPGVERTVRQDRRDGVTRANGACGAGVDGFAPGDAVSVVPPLSMVRWPAYGERATFPAALVVKHPPSLGWDVAAAAWMQYLTAYGALIDIAELRSEDVVVADRCDEPRGLEAETARQGRRLDVCAVEGGRLVVGCGMLP
jgi:NADPH:quinone reductase-like Zn-dependent oxidoreductase